MKSLSMQRTQAEIEQAMTHLGLTPDTLQMLLFFPVFYVAWADQKLTDKEIAALLDIARDAGLDEGSTGEVLKQWISEKPTETFLKSGLFLVGVFLKTEDSKTKGSILELVERIASQSHGVFGRALAYSQREEDAIQKISAALGLHSEESRQRLLEAALEDLSEGEKIALEPIQWGWVQIASLVAVILLGSVLALQRWTMQWLTGGSAFSFAGSPLPFGWSLVLFVGLPLVPFAVGGALIGWKSEGEIQREAILSVLIPLAFFWGFWLVFTFATGSEWNWSRFGYRFLFTILAAFVSAMSAKAADYATSSQRTS